MFEKYEKFWIKQIKSLNNEQVEEKENPKQRIQQMITFNLRRSDMQNNTSYPFYESEVPVSMWKIYVQGFLAMFIVISGFNLVLSALLFFPWNAVNAALQGPLELPFWSCFGGLWALELLLFFLIILAPKPPSDGIEYPFESKEQLV